MAVPEEKKKMTLLDLKSPATLAKQKYWNEYYKNDHKITSDRSDFAAFVASTYLGYDPSLPRASPKMLKPSGDSHVFLDLGCGNARDTSFFASLPAELSCVGIDLSDMAIKRNREKYPHVAFHAGDLAELDNVLDLKGKLDHVYCRFVLHAVSPATQSVIFQTVAKWISPGGRFYMEARTRKDSLYKQGTPHELHPHAFVTDHYRRFLDRAEVEEELKSNGFTIERSEESDTFSVHKEDRPHLFRIVAVGPKKK